MRCWLRNEAWPGLRERVAQGAVLQEVEAERLEATILAAFLRELDDQDEPTARGKEIDELHGLVAQLRLGYYR
jgi:hypothetical protein